VRRAHRAQGTSSLGDASISLGDAAKRRLGDAERLLGGGLRQASVAGLVARWRSARSLGDGSGMAHACSYKTCSYHQISNQFICEQTGRVHECGDLCGERVVRTCELSFGGNNNGLCEQATAEAETT
jgi:hypothetical protein